MKIKPGVDLNGLKPEILVGLMVLESHLGPNLVVTCGTDGKHMAGSLHYAGMAVDIRLDSSLVIEEVKTDLGPQFDFVVEHDHYHLEFQPKG